MFCTWQYTRGPRRYTISIPEKYDDLTAVRQYIADRTGVKPGGIVLCTKIIERAA